MSERRCPTCHGPVPSAYQKYCCADCAPYARLSGHPKDAKPITILKPKRRCHQGCPSKDPFACVSMDNHIPIEDVTSQDQCPCRCHDVQVTDED